MTLHPLCIVLYLIHTLWWWVYATIGSMALCILSHLIRCADRHRHESGSGIRRKGGGGHQKIIISFFSLLILGINFWQSYSNFRLFSRVISGHFGPFWPDFSPKLCVRCQFRDIRSRQRRKIFQFCKKHLIPHFQEINIC